MKKTVFSRFLSLVKPFLVGAVLLACFLCALGGLQNDRAENDCERLEYVLRRAAVSCYAEEGFYPPDLKYIEEKYGISPDTEKYAVHYEIFAENLMPQISVVEIP